MRKRTGEDKPIIGHHPGEIRQVILSLLSGYIIVFDLIAEIYINPIRLSIFIVLMPPIQKFKDNFLFSIYT